MISYHPDSRLLTEYSAGSLALAQSVCVSLHLGYCEQCQRQARQLQQVGASFFENLSPEPVDEKMLDSILSRLDEPAPLSYETTSEPHHSPGVKPPLVQRLMKGDYEDLNWKRIGSAVQISHLKTGDVDNEFALYHIKAGRSVPQHTHRGTELTLVLEGSFSDEEGIYQVGDFLIRDAKDIHTPTATQSADCICIGVLDAPIRFTRWNYWLLNPFMRLQAS
ncbi:MAG: putative transcriptional regulator [Halieaceae bacterium]|jgi:putative transcriptional regulator